MLDAAYGLGRRARFDARSRGFAVRELIPAGARPRSYTWRCDVALNQGKLGACVGFAWAAELAARPVVVAGVDDAKGLELYRLAQALDEFPDTPPAEGSSVLGGAQAAHREGYLEEYRWAFSLEDLVLALGYRGPAVLGINWYESMFRPTPSGVLSVAGDLAGEHAILANGVDLKRRLVRLHNSWGDAWGINGGEALIGFDDLDRLLHEQGEACVPVKRGRPR